MRRGGSLNAIVRIRRLSQGAFRSAGRREPRPSASCPSEPARATNVSVPNRADAVFVAVALVLTSHHVRRVAAAASRRRPSSSRRRVSSPRATWAAPSRRSRAPGRGVSRPCRGTRRCPRRSRRAADRERLGTSIWTWSMWSRFQTGSNRPLANRSARMFCTASLPRKWSIRKIWDSSNAVRSVAFSARADARSCAERLLHDHPRGRVQPGRRARRRSRRRGRGYRQVMQQARPCRRSGAARR